MLKKNYSVFIKKNLNLTIKKQKSKIHMKEFHINQGNFTYIFIFEYDENKI